MVEIIKLKDIATEINTEHNKIIESCRACFITDLIVAAMRIPLRPWKNNQLSPRNASGIR